MLSLLIILTVIEFWARDILRYFTWWINYYTKLSSLYIYTDRNIPWIQLCHCGLLLHPHSSRKISIKKFFFFYFFKTLLRCNIDWSFDNVVRRNWRVIFLKAISDRKTVFLMICGGDACYWFYYSHWTGSTNIQLVLIVSLSDLMCLFSYADI